MEYTKVYAPWSIINHLENVRVHLNHNSSIPEPKNFWASSGGGAMLGSLFKMTASNHEFTNKLRNILPSLNEVNLPYKDDMSLYNTASLNNNSFSEEVITYLMFNSGYLAARKSNDDGYLFKIPNKEVRDEFFHILSRQVKTLDKVISTSNDTSLIATRNELKDLQIFLNKQIEFCAYQDSRQPYEVIITAKSIIEGKILLGESLVFNKTNSCLKSNVCWHDKLDLFHLSALLNDTDSFEVLSNNCRTNQLSKTNELSGIKTVDVAFIQKNVAILDILKQSNVIMMPLEVPNKYFHKYYCGHSGSKISISIISAGISTLVKWLGPAGLPIYFAQQAFSSLIKLGIKDGTKDLDNICKEYHQYDDINPNSLLGFKKYIQEHPNTLVARGEACPAQYKKIAKTAVDVGIDEQEVNFSLCSLGEVTTINHEDEL